MTNSNQQESKHLTNLQNNKLRDFLSGLIAGFFSVTICHPLDIIRTRLNIMNSPNHQIGKYFGFKQAAKMIFKQEGIGGFYLGYRTTVIGVPLFNCFFFPIYQQSKKHLINSGHSRQVAYCFSSIIAGSICNILTNPIWVLRTRIMVQYLYPQKHQFIETHPIPMIRKLVKEEGWKSMFKGLSASTLSISNAIIYFLLYQQLKERVLEKNKVFNSYYVFAVATFSKAISSTLTYPLIVIRTILHDHRADEHLKISSIIKHIYKQSGIKGFYGGLKPDLVRIVPSNAILFVTYEYMKRVM